MFKANKVARDSIANYVAILDAANKERKARIRNLKEEISEIYNARILGERAIKSLSSLQRKFSKNDFESRTSIFSNNFRINDLVNGLVQGTVSENQVWSSICQAQDFVRVRRPVYSGIPMGRSGPGLSDILEQVIINGPRIRSILGQRRLPAGGLGRRPISRKNRPFFGSTKRGGFSSGSGF